MNAKDYISSGAIEACIMGLADEDDWLELAEMIVLDDEVRLAKDAFEEQLEKHHFSNALPPPSSIKQKLLQSLEFEADMDETKVVSMPASATPGKPMVVPLVPTPKPMRWLQRAVAASVILLMGSILLNFHFYGKSVEYRKDYEALALQQNTLLAKNKAMEASFNTIKDPGTKLISMGATAAKPGSLATVYWNMHSKDVYLMVNHLPPPGSGKQYQLWAIVNGKPVDAGMLETGNGDNLLQKMHKMPDAQAFAITLEKSGGSPTPTMEAMYVYGGV